MKFIFHRFDFSVRTKYKQDMKKLFSLFLVLTLLLGGFFTPVGDAFAYVSVKGYYKSNGTYVAPYVRSNPNGLKYDNYGYTPSQDLYNETYGTRGMTWDTPTYITDPNYYEGQALYQSNSVTPSAGSNVNTVSTKSHLTSTQIQSILNLLISFNADSSVVTSVAAALKN